MSAPFKTQDKGAREGPRPLHFPKRLAVQAQRLVSGLTMLKRRPFEPQDKLDRRTPKEAAPDWRLASLRKDWDFGGMPQKRGALLNENSMPERSLPRQ